MSAKIYRVKLALICAVLLLLSPPAGGTRQTLILNDPADSSQEESAGQSALEESEPEPEPESELEPESEPEPEPEPELEPELEPEQEPEHIEIAPMLDVAPGERVVKTFTELDDALSKNNGVSIVHLGADIVMDGGIHVHDSKTSLVIDGIDPTNPGQTKPYTLTEFNGAAYYYAIYANSSGIKSVHVKDLNIIGKNFYGPFCVVEVEATDELVLTYERVDYNGPQIGHHRRGTIRFIDCAIRIHGGNGVSAAQEVAEAKYISFYGRNTIDTATTAYSIFWHLLGGTFALADDASLTVHSPNTSGTYGMFYSSGVASKIDITIGQRAVFDATVTNMLASSAITTISGLTIQEGGAFRLTTTGSTGLATRPVAEIDGNLTVEPDASFQISAYGNANPVVDIPAGNVTVDSGATFHIVAANTASSLLNLYGRPFSCNDPASVILRNPGNRTILATTNAAAVSVEAEQINYWRQSNPSGPGNPPLYHWKKADGTNMRISGTQATGASGKLGGISTNYEAGDSPGTAPDASTFDTVTARVLALGRLELAVNPPLATSVDITGITAPGAVVRASFRQQDVDYTLTDATANEHGVFTIPVAVPLLPGTLVTVTSSWKYLLAEQTVTVVDTGRLAFTAPDTLPFYTAGLAAKTRIVERLHDDWHLLVSDTRGPGQSWRVFVSQLSPLAPDDPAKPALDHALIFVADDGAVTPLDAVDALLIYEHTTATGNEIVDIGWDANRGVLVRVPTGAGYSGPKYTAILEWTLVDGP